VGGGTFRVVAWYIPMTVGGILLATLSGLILDKIPGTGMAILTCLAIIVDSLLFALLS
jgi:hypothetical protein